MFSSGSVIVSGMFDFDVDIGLFGVGMWLVWYFEKVVFWVGYVSVV